MNLSENKVKYDKGKPLIQLEIENNFFKFIKAIHQSSIAMSTLMPVIDTPP